MELLGSAISTSGGVTTVVLAALAEQGYNIDRLVFGLSANPVTFVAVTIAWTGGTFTVPLTAKGIAPVPIGLTTPKNNAVTITIPAESGAVGYMNVIGSKVYA